MRSIDPAHYQKPERLPPITVEKIRSLGSKINSGSMPATSAHASKLLEKYFDGAPEQISESMGSKEVRDKLEQAVAFRQFPRIHDEMVMTEMSAELEKQNKKVITRGTKIYLSSLPPLVAAVLIRLTGIGQAIENLTGIDLPMPFLILGGLLQLVAIGSEIYRATMDMTKERMDESVLAAEEFYDAVRTYMKQELKVQQMKLFK